MRQDDINWPALDNMGDDENSALFRTGFRDVKRQTILEKHE